MSLATAGIRESCTSPPSEYLQNNLKAFLDFCALSDFIFSVHVLVIYLKSVALELLSLNVQKFMGSRDPGHAPIFENAHTQTHMKRKHYHYLRCSLRSLGGL